MNLDDIRGPEDLAGLSREELQDLAVEIRDFIVESVSVTGGHLGSNLGVVELTLALHRVFESPKDVLLWDTGHQTYVHKLLTGRKSQFPRLRQPGGMSGYPSRRESEHDWIENSHASAALSYAHGIAKGFEHLGQSQRQVVAVIGDGSLTGGMAYEALNNLGHAGSQVIIVLNDNGRSYAPTVTRLSLGLTQLRLHPSYMHAREQARRRLRSLPAVGELAYQSVHGLTSALREMVTPHRFFEALGVRYVGPIDGHDIERVEHALESAKEWSGPILIHVLTTKGRGYGPAEEDEVQCLHDVKVSPAAPTGTAQQVAPASYTDAFTRAILTEAERRPELVAITAAMPGPTGLLPFQALYPDRFVDVGIAEQHAVAAAAGMAMAGLRPVVALYSTFFTRAFDQANLDVGLHSLPVVFVLDRAGITGDDGPSHHGVLDLSLALSIPGMTVFAPSSAGEVEVMLSQALALDGPSTIRFPKTPARNVTAGEIGSGMNARLVRRGDSSVCILAVGKMLAAAEDAAKVLEDEGVGATVWDVRVVSPPDRQMLADAARHDLVLTVEDGLAVGGAGSFLAASLSDLGDSTYPSPRVCVVGTPRRFIAQGKPETILHELGLDGPGIASLVVAAMARDDRLRLT